MNAITDSFPGVLGVNKGELKAPQQLDEDLVQLDNGDVLAQTLVLAIAEDELVVPLPLLDHVPRWLVTALGRVEPPLRAE